MSEYKISKYVRSRTDEELLEDFKKVANYYNGQISQKLYNDYRKNIDSNIADSTTVCRQIGWRNALQLVGVKLNKFQSNHKITEEELLEELLRLWVKLQRQPTTSDIKSGLCKYPRNRFSDRFGSWGNTLEQFIKWTNNKNFLTPDVSNAVEKKAGHKTSREINLKLRYSVLVRDNFKCCVCGASPAKDPNVELHIDHIKPWSKGGETVLENLQTLCSNCNYGKGNSA